MLTRLRFVLFAILTLISLNAGATSFIERPLDDTVADTPVLVRGKVGNSIADYGLGPDGTKRLYTIYDVTVTDVIKGNAKVGDTVHVRELGGEKDGIGMMVAGAAHFDRGEDVVLTLANPNADGSYDLRGLSSGKYLVRQDENGQDYIVGNGAPGPQNPGGQGATSVKNLVTLDMLRDIVKKQGPTPPAATPQKSTVSSPSPSPSAANSQAAPRLQTQDSMEPEGKSGFGSGAAFAVALGLGAIGAGIFWVTRRRR